MGMLLGPLDGLGSGGLKGRIGGRSCSRKEGAKSSEELVEGLDVCGETEGKSGEDAFRVTR